MNKTLKTILIFVISLIIIIAISNILFRTIIPISVLASSNMEPAYNQGDLIFYEEPKDLIINDAIIFQTGRNNVVSRIISINPDGNYVAKGDANSQSLNSIWINETNIKKEEIVGKVTARISPYIFYPISYGIQAVIAILITLLISRNKKREK